MVPSISSHASGGVAIASTFFAIGWSAGKDTVTDTGARGRSGATVVSSDICNEIESVCTAGFQEAELLRRLARLRLTHALAIT